MADPKERTSLRPPFVQRLLAGQISLVGLFVGLAATTALFSLAGWRMAGFDNLLLIVVALLAGLTGAYLAFWLCEKLLGQWAFGSQWLLIISVMIFVIIGVGTAALIFDGSFDLDNLLPIVALLLYSSSLLLVRIQVRNFGLF